MIAIYTLCSPDRKLVRNECLGYFNTPILINLRLFFDILSLSSAEM